jgi:hypothetical protein
MAPRITVFLAVLIPIAPADPLAHENTPPISPDYRVRVTTAGIKAAGPPRAPADPERKETVI